jgi:hemolysin III
MSPMTDPAYPDFARSERVADGVIHLLGVIFAIIGAVLLIIFAAIWVGKAQIAAVSIYGAALIATFVASACYHMTPWERLRPVLQKIDHAAIYLKIAGTYTPLVVLIGSGFGYVMLGLVWILAVLGAAAKLFFWAKPGRLAPLLYLLLGWLSLSLIWSLAQNLPLPATVLVVIGGLLYSAGVIFFSWEKLKYAYAIWHGFVLAASACFFAAITLGTFAGVS